MSITDGTAVAGTLAAIQRACLRANPCMDLDVDLLAVSRAAACSSTADWTAQTLSNVAVDSRSGAVMLAQTTASAIFQQTTDHSVAHFMTDGQAGTANKGREEYALDFFPDPSIYGGVPFALDSLDVYLSLSNGLAQFTSQDSVFRVQVSAYDARWRLVPLGDPIDIQATAVLVAMGAFAGIYKIDLRQGGRRFVFSPGSATTRTGPGLTSAGAARVVGVDATGASTLVVARGLSISIVPMGTGFQAASIGCASTGSLAPFDTTQFWRVAANRNMGPYDPAIVGYGGADVGHNPDDNLTTGAVPGYGAITASDGVSKWGIARRVQVAQRGQDSANGWHRPYHVLRAVTYQASGAATAVLDMGAVPVNPVEVRLNDFQPTGTSIAYTLSGSNTSGTSGFVSIGTVADGQQLTGANLYRWYKLVATLTAGPSGATKFATPALLAWQMVERVTLSTYRYLEQFDADATVDPVTGQSSVAELKLPMLRGGVRNFRDLATRVNSEYAPSSVEAHVYARNTVTGERLFLNSFRLENRNPQDGAEEMTFTGGMDLLTALVPPAVESYTYPTPGSVGAAITLMAGILNHNPNPASTQMLTVGVSGTPFSGVALAGLRYHGVTGAAAGYDYRITGDTPRDTAGNALTAGAGFVIDTNVATVGGVGTPGPIPAIGDTFEIHSDTTTRGPVTYPGNDFAAIATDVLNVQSAVPARYRGQLPATTGRISGAYTLPSEGAKAADVLAAVGLHCQGAFQWMRGRVSFFDVYGPKVSKVTWDERHYTKLDTPLGADRRMPSIRAKYDYQSDTKQFAFELRTDDADTVEGWGRANLFDTFDLPDELCVWNDAAGTEAQFLTAMLQSAWKSGVRIWDVETAMQYPWLDFGDAVTIMTDQYTDRRLQFAADGVTDIGQPIAGRVAAVGVIVGKNLWGDKFKIAIRGLDAITTASSNALGAVPGTVAVPAMPTPSITFDGTGQAIVSVVGDAATANIRYLVRNDRAPTLAEVRAAGTTAGNNLVNVASGVTIAMSGTGWIGALAYNAAGDESPLGITSQARSNIAAPSLQIVPSLTNNQTDDTVSPVTVTATATNLPATYTWAIYQGYSRGQYSGTATYSGSNSSNPLSGAGFSASVTPTAKNSKWFKLVITVGSSTYVAETQVQGIIPFLSNATGQAATGAQDSGGRAVNTMYAKPLAADPDNMDSINNGLTFGGAKLAYLDSGRPNALYRSTGAASVNADVLAASMGTAGPNLLANGNAEDGVLGGLVGWTFENGNTMKSYDVVKKLGSRSWLIDNSVTANDSYAYQDVPVIAGRVYKLSAWINCGGLTGAGYGAVLNLGGVAPGQPSAGFTMLDKVGDDPSPTIPAVGIHATGGTGNDDGQWHFVHSLWLNTVTTILRFRLQLGYTGNITGQAFFDDVTIQEMSPTTSQGGARGYSALDSNARLASQRNLKMLASAGPFGTVLQFVHGTSTPIAPVSSSGTSVSVAAHDAKIGSGAVVAYSSGSLGTWPAGQPVYVYCLDDTFAGGTGSSGWLASNSMYDILSNDSIYYAGQVTPASSGGGGGATCPDPDEPILLADGREMRAGDLSIGDLVRTAHEETGEWGVHQVSHVQRVERTGRTRLVLTDGREIVASPTHPVYVENPDNADEVTKTCVLRLRQGMRLAGTVPGVVSHIEDAGIGPVMVIEVEGAHTYVLRGILSHNKVPQ